MYARTAGVGLPSSRFHVSRVLPSKLLPNKYLQPLPGRLARSQPRVVCAAEDPYKVLGVAKDADNNEINRAYSRKKYEFRSNDAALAKVEAAHSQLMLSALTARMKGGASRDIKYADREALFPWRPKRWDATPKVIMIIGVMQLAMIFYGFQQPSMSKCIFCGLIGIAGNVMKQNAISPPPKDPNTATEEEAGRAGRNFVRGLLLGIGATFAGILLSSAPEIVVTQVKSLTLPAFLTNSRTLVFLKVASAAICNWTMTAFYY